MRRMEGFSPSIRLAVGAFGDFMTGNRGLSVRTEPIHSGCQARDQQLACSPDPSVPKTV